MPAYKKKITSPLKDKFILDPCCGPKYMWVNKKHPNVLYGDIRQKKKGFTQYRKNLCVAPDMVLDFRDMPFKNGCFKLVVFDPPHLFKGKTELNLHKAFGSLSKTTWRRDIKQGFDECWRVLELFGVLIFKWSDYAISFKEIIKTLGKEPLFYNKFGNTTKSFWACFMKFPEEYNTQEVLE